MPIVPRTNKKATKIAWKVLGKPSNIATPQTEKEKWLDKRFDYDAIVQGR